MKKTLALLLTAIMLLSAMAVSANAAIPPQLYGDAYYDTDINIMDATAIQQHLANIEQLYPDRYEAADVDGDSNISIIDATTIQMYLANIITEFPAGEYFLVDKYFYDVIPSYLSGKAQVGVPVDFEVSGYAYPEPSKAYLYVSDELVDTAVGEDSTLTYTFPEEGIYAVKVVLTDKWGFEAGEWTQGYEVVAPVTDTTKPFIKNIAITDRYSTEPVITVDVINGSGEYRYSYFLSGTYISDEFRDFIYTKRNVAENSIRVDYGHLDYFETYVITVIVTDSNGITVEATTSFVCEELAPA